MSMRVRMLDTGNVVDYDDSYALRLIEQGQAVLVSGDEPITPTPTPYDPSEYDGLFRALQAGQAALQAEIDALGGRAGDDGVFASLYQSIAQAQERQLEYNEAHLQEEIDEIAGNGE